MLRKGGGNMLMAPKCDTYCEMLRAIRRKRIGTHLRHPLRPILKLMGWNMPYPYYRRFVEYSRWPGPVAKKLLDMPSNFITNWSLSPETAFWLFQMVRDTKPKCIVEFGCGASTVVIAAAMEMENMSGSFISLEGETQWLNCTKKVLEKLNLQDRVRLSHAPVQPFGYGQQTFHAHDVSVLSGVRADLLFVDAPPSAIGRVGVLPCVYKHLAPGATIILDDAERDQEHEAISVWEDLGLATVTGFEPVGAGVAILVAND